MLANQLNFKNVMPYVNCKFELKHPSLIVKNIDSSKEFGIFFPLSNIDEFYEVRLLGTLNEYNMVGVMVKDANGINVLCENIIKTGNSFDYFYRGHFSANSQLIIVLPQPINKALKMTLDTNSFFTQTFNTFQCSRRRLNPGSKIYDRSIVHDYFGNNIYVLATEFAKWLYMKHQLNQLGIYPKFATTREIKNALIFETGLYITNKQLFEDSMDDIPKTINKQFLIEQKLGDTYDFLFHPLNFYHVNKNIYPHVVLYISAPHKDFFNSGSQFHILIKNLMKQIYPFWFGLVKCTDDEKLLDYKDGRSITLNPRLMILKENVEDFTINVKFHINLDPSAQHVVSTDHVLDLYKNKKKNTFTDPKLFEDSYYLNDYLMDQFPPGG